MAWSMVVEGLGLERTVGTTDGYRLWLRMGGHVFTRRTDGNLGHVMSVCSDLWKSIALTAGQAVAERTTPILTSPMVCEEMGVRRSLVPGEAWKLRMVSGPYTYEAGMDTRLESVMNAFTGAMTFFSFKYGYTTLDPEVVRNRDQALKAGLTTKEDHIPRAKPKGKR